MKDTENKNSASLESIIKTAIKLPGIKVKREAFLKEQFGTLPPEQLEMLMVDGPVKAGCSQDELRKKARKLIRGRTLASTGASFLAGLPGGLAMTATIPADMIQFFAVALRLAQEIAYLYGGDDLWKGDELDTEKVTHQLILYFGVMVGASGAPQAVRVLSSSLAQQALKKLPHIALTKTFYYPVVKSIAKAFGTNISKEIFAKGISKVVPIIGGVVSGGITFVTLRPMAKRLVDTLDEANFSYSQNEFEADWSTLVVMNDEEDGLHEESTEACQDHAPEDVKQDSIETAAEYVVEEQADEVDEKADPIPFDEFMKKIQDIKQLLDQGIITDEEFVNIKARLIARL